MGSSGGKAPEGISIGPPGEKGADGATIRSGEGIPSSELGVNGDYYIDKASHKVYGPKAGAVWGAATSLVGERGEKGLTGAEGVKGATGAVGATGPEGIEGPRGLKGDTGAIGSQGEKGSVGATGEIGAAGAKGSTGAEGLAATLGAWKEISLETGIANKGEPYSKAEVSKDSMGLVYLRGIIKSSGLLSKESTIVNLPEGYRPAKQQLINANLGGTIGFLSILPNGKIQISLGVSLETIFSFDGILFPLT